MGMISSLAGVRDRAYARAAERVTAGLDVPPDPSLLPMVTPWSTNELSRIVADDVFPNGLPPLNTRAAAMRIPAIARARNLLVATICNNPLVALQGTDPIAEQPTWLYRSDDGASPQHRLAWTVDDLIFYGWSLWWRELDYLSRFPLSVRRVNQADWSVNADMKVLVNGVEVDDRNVILIPGLHEGILSYGRDALDDARTLYANVRRRLENPAPTLNLKQTGGRDLTDGEIDKLIDRWAAARRGKNGGVSYTNQHVEPQELGAGGEQLMIDARNAAALDLARIVGVAGSRIDATVDKASLTYETTTGRNQEFVDFDLDLYTTPIEARLSLDDCVARGTRVVIDVGNLTAPAPSPTGPPHQD